MTNDDLTPAEALRALADGETLNNVLEQTCAIMEGYLVILERDGKPRRCNEGAPSKLMPRKKR